MEKVAIKICGMRQAANVAAVADLLPDYMGFIFYPNSPRYVNEVSAELIKYVPASIKTVGVFVNEDIDVIKSMIFKHNLKAVQLHGAEEITYCEALKETGVDVIKAFGVMEGFDFNQLEAYLPVVNYFLFDTQTAAYGGSGKVFDWQMLANYKLDKPYFLSGGIALTHVKPLKEITDKRLFAIDVNSKFELEPGLKDVDKLKEFIFQIRK